MAAALGVPRRSEDLETASLTFDDGPHPQGTPAVLERLREAGAGATFFLVGEQVERDPSLATEIVFAGHGIAVHGHRHRNLLRLTPRQFSDDLERGVAAIADATGVEPSLYRPPYGIFSPAGLRIVRRSGLEPILWSAWGHDWRSGQSGVQIAEELTGDLRGADVLLLHDADHYSARGCWRATVEAIPHAVAAIERAGLRPAAI